LDWAGFHSWLDTFPSGPIVRFKRDRLVAVAGADERHLSIGLSWSVPWAVLRILEPDVHEVPTRAPAVPTR